MELGISIKEGIKDGENWLEPHRSSGTPAEKIIRANICSKALLSEMEVGLFIFQKATKAYKASRASKAKGQQV